MTAPVALSRRAFCAAVAAASCTRSTPRPTVAARPRSDVVDEAVATLLRRMQLGELRSLPLEARAEGIFSALYNTIEHPKACAIDQATYASRLAARGLRAETKGPWHVRWGLDGTADLSRDARRLYFNVVPDDAVALVDHLARGLDERDVRRWSSKVLSALDTFDVPVAAVLYLEGPDYAVGRSVAMSFVAGRGRAFAPDVAPFTRVLAPGVGAADEIGAVGPPGVSGNSFGGAMSYLLARACERAPADRLAAAMREELRAAGFDPRRPWLRPGHASDD